MTINSTPGRQQWENFLSAQTWTPFLQSWTMAEVYRDVGQDPIRLAVEDGGKIVGICFAHLVPAKRGRHLSIPYGPLLASDLSAIEITNALEALFNALAGEAIARGCAFLRLSPFWPLKPSPLSTIYDQLQSGRLGSFRIKLSPLHLLAEHLWYLDLRGKSEEQILGSMRKTTRNLIRRAQKDGVTVRASAEPDREIDAFLTLHEETRRRHSFTPYTDAFFRAELQRFAEDGQATLYLAEFEGKIIASSIHIHAYGETSYHHGASADAFKKIPASYLLQWTAICDALKRSDRLYNFWGIAPPENQVSSLKAHPFAGVTLFKTGFGGQLLALAHCMDIPLSARYHVTRAIETLRKWRRGF